MVSRFYHIVQSLLPFFSLPTLKVLRAAVPYSDLPFSWPASQPWATYLRTLRICRSKVDLAFLSQILLRTPNLTTLEYDMVRKVDIFMQNGPYLKCCDLEAAIACVAPTLINLKLHVQF